MAKQPLILTVLAGFRGDGLKTAQKQLNDLGNTVNRVSRNALKAGAGLAISKGWQGFTRVAESAVTQARDLERNLAALDTVFGSLSPQLERFSKNAVDVGLSQSEAAKASVFLGSVLKQSGFSIEETAAQTERLVKLGADLALTYGYDVQEALLGMTALFRGEYDPIEKFGVAMKQSEINSELAAQGLDKLEGAERRLAEQQIRLNLLFERSIDAQGAFQRQSGTLAVEQERLQASINNMLQTAGTPLLQVLANLAERLVPITEDLAPVLVELFDDLAKKAEVAFRDTESLQTAIVNTARAFSEIIQVAGAVALFLGQNAVAVTRLVAAFVAFKVAAKGVYVFTAALSAYRTAALAATTATVALNVATRASIFGAVAAGIVLLTGSLLDYKNTLDITEEAEADGNETRKETLDRISQLKSEIANINTAISNGTADASAYESQLKTLNEELRRLEGAANAAATQVTGIGNAFSFSAGEANRFLNLQKGFVAEYKPPTLAPDPEDKKESGGGQAKNYVKDFYDTLAEEVKKQAARVRLETMGASEGLIAQILSGEGWEKVFNTVISKGVREVARLQQVFNKTGDGIKELADKLQEELDRIDQEYAQAIANQEQAISDLQSAYEQAGDAVDAAAMSFAQFFDEFTVLPTTEREIGRFEQQAISSLENIKSMLDSTLATLGEDFRQSYNELLSYAQKEFATLQNIQRQRDELAKKRSLAEALIGDVRAATLGAANITSLFSKAQAAAGRVNATDVIAETIEAGRDLKEFRVTIMRDIVEPMATAGSVIDGFRDIVLKTRAFIDNLKTLKALGLDPQLFNQLVEAGVEAGGETAQALVDGGAEAITELNGLFGELDALGAELGEQTAQVMYGAGVDLTNGIIEGIAAEQAALEEQAMILADAFELVFKTELEAAMDAVLEAIRLRVEEAKAELARILAEMEAAKAAARQQYPEAAGGTQETVKAVEEVAQAVEKVAKETKSSAASATEAAKETAKSSASLAQVIKKTTGATAGEANRFANLAKSAGITTPSQLSARSTSGIAASGMAHLASLQSMGSSNVTINVQANSRTQGTQAGEAIVQMLNKYTSVSGGSTLKFVAR